MLKAINCLSCGTRTRTVFQTTRTKFNDSSIVINNAPMHYCHNCHETMVSVEVLNLLRYLKTLRLAKGVNEFDFEDTYRKVKVV